MEHQLLAGRYEIVEHLGAGSFGQTFVARDLHLPGQPVCVVKQLQPKVNDAETMAVAKRFFDREAETLYKLGEHDRIPRLLAHFEQDGQFYLIQEFVEGNPLNREIEPGKPLAETEVIAILQDVLEVLAFVHAQNIIHRDIKPANLIRRSRDRKIVVIDFGAVKRVGNLAENSASETSQTVAIGSPAYMPNEQLAGQPRFSSDLYALGLTCFQALTGLLPRELPQDPRTSEYSWTLCAKKVSIKISPELARILDKMVRYDDRDRYQNATIALRDLESVLQSDSTIVTNPLSAQITPTTLITPVNSGARSQIPQLSEIPTTARSTIAINAVKMSQQQYRDRQVLLNKVRNFWIEGVLETSLHDKALIELGLESRPEALERPWSISWETPESSRQEISSETKVINLFDRLGMGRTLLILGEPGAGKTTTLLEISRDLIRRAESDPSLSIPIVFNLSSWQERQTLADWLVLELKTKYQVPKKISRELVDKQGLQLMLDGLDEVASDRRNACVETINRFHQQYGQTEIVVCSRIRDYEALSQRLQFQGAIFIQGLTDAQIDRYFAQMGEPLVGVREMLSTDAKLMELARSPLMLSIMSIAYRGISVTELIRMSLQGNHVEHLFDTYIDAMLQRRPSREYTPKQTKRWLSWLAKQLVSNSQTVFLIENLQPESLPQSQRNLYAFIAGIAISVPIAFLIFPSLTFAATRLVNLDVVNSVTSQFGGDLPIFVSDLIDLNKVLNFSISSAVIGGLTTGGMLAIAKTLNEKFLSSRLGRIFFAALNGLACLFFSHFILKVRDFPHIWTPILGLLWMLVSFFLVDLINKPILPTDKLRWSWQNAKNKAFEGQLWGLTFGIIAAILITLADLGIFATFFKIMEPIK